MHKLRSIALILEGVIELGIAHPHDSGLIAGHIIAELLLPTPVVGAASLLSQQVVDDLSMNNVYESLDSTPQQSHE